MISISRTEKFDIVENLAMEIWPDYFAGKIISRTQTFYMLGALYNRNALKWRTERDERFWVIRDDDKPIGFFSFIPNEDNVQLKAVFLLKDYRNRGLLRDSIIPMLKKYGNRITLMVNRKNADAIEAYRHCGFVVVSDMDVDLGCYFVAEDHLMELRAD
jgi:GNAT superfamily N-acetyltransferase